MIDNKTNKLYFSYFAAASVNMMSIIAGMGYGWSSPYILNLNGEKGPDSNPLPQPATLQEISWVTSLHCLGAMSGPLFTGIIASYLGKKKTLLIFSIPQILSNIILIFANNITLFYIARFLLGIGTGCVFSLIPIYVAEISQPSHRGKSSMFLPFMLSLAQDFVFIVGPHLSVRIMAMIFLIPSVIFLITFGIFVPETPYYYIKNNKLKKAETALIKTRRTIHVNDELMDIVKSIKEADDEFSLKALISSKTARKSFFLSFGLMFFQQFNGINAIASYQQSIFNESKSSIPADKSVMIVGSVQIIALCLVSKLVDNWGRKNLLICSYLGQLISLLSLGIFFHLVSNNIDLDSLSWLPLTNVLIYMLSFKLGAGPVSWTITSEIFPPNFKFVLSPLIAFFMTFMSFLVTFVFPRFSAKFGMEISFWGFSGIVACAIPFVVFFVPETKGKTFLEIQHEIKGSSDF